jgi:hypothetical protein
MDNKLINFILDNYKGLRRDRNLRIASGQLKNSDPEFKHHILNELVYARREIIKYFQLIETLYEYRKIHSKNYKCFEKAGEISNAAETHIKIAEINKMIGDITNVIASYGGYVIDVLRFDMLSDHEVCQIFNINYKTFKDRKKHYFEICGDKEEHIVYLVLSVCGPEYRHRRGRAKGIYDCLDSEMPIYWAMHKHIMQEMKNNEEFNEAINKVFKEIFPEIKTYKAVKDLEGNVMRVVEDN